MAINVGTGVVRVVPDFTGFATSVKRGVGSSFQQIGDASREAGRALLPLSIAAGGIIAASAAMATQFEKDFVKIEALVGDTAANLAELRPQVLALAGAAGIGPRELADALFFVESAGLRGQEAFEVLDRSARAAAVGLGNTAQVADALTSAVNAYASTGLSAADATDVLVASVREGKIEADTLAQSIGRVIPIAAQLGVEFHEVGAAIAASTRVGLTAEEATTALRQALVTLLKPSAQAQDTLREFGFSAEGLRKRIADDGLLSTLQLMFERFGDNQEAVNKVFQNVRALTGIFALVGGNAEQVQGVFDRLANSTGDLNKAFEATRKSTAFRLSVALAELERAAISLGDVFLPVLISIANGISTVADAFANLPAPVKDVVARMLTIIALTAPLLLVAGALLRTAAAATIVKGAHTGAAVAATAQAKAELQLASASTASAAAQGQVAAATRVRAGIGGRVVGGALKGVGIAIGADFLAGFIQSVETESGTTADAVKDTMANALRGAGIGAGIGLAIGGPVAAGVGAAIGAGFGALIGFVRSQAEGLEEEIEARFDPFSNTEFAQASGIKFGLAAAQGIEEGLEEVNVEPIFFKLLEAIGEATEDLTLALTQFGSEVPNLFANAFETAEDDVAITLADIKANVAAELAGFTELEDGLADLTRRGLLRLAESISNEGGPAALQALAQIRRGLIDDPQGIFALEADLNRLEGGLRDQFSSFLRGGGIETGGISQNLRDMLLPDDLAELETDITKLFVQDLPAIGERFVTVAGPIFRDALLRGMREGFIEAAESEDILPENLDQIIADTITDAEVLDLIKAEIKTLRIEAGGIELDFAGTTFPEIKVPTGIAFTSFGTGRIEWSNPPPISITTEMDLLALQGFDFVDLNFELAKELKEWAINELPDLLAQTDFSGGDLTIEEALLTAFEARVKELTAEKIAERVSTDAIAGGVALSTVTSILAGMGPVGEAIADQIEAQVNSVATNVAATSAGSGPGGSIAEGVLEGWDLVWPGVASQIAADVGALEGKVKVVTGSESPSKVYAKIGADIVRGFNIGIQSIPLASIPLPAVQGSLANGGSHVEVNIHNPRTNNLVRDTDRALRLARTNQLVRR